MTVLYQSACLSGRLYHVSYVFCATGDSRGGAKRAIIEESFSFGSFGHGIAEFMNSSGIKLVICVWLVSKRFIIILVGGGSLNSDLLI